MNKILKGYELMKEIAEGKINTKTKIFGTIIVDGNTFKEDCIFEDNELFDSCGDELFKDYTTKTIVTSYFEIIQDEPDEIEELDDGYDLKGLATMGYDVSRADYKIINEVCKNRNKINELIRKVNEINRKLEEK